MSKRNKTTAIYQNPDDAPINYGEDNMAQKSDRVETSEAPIVNSIETVAIDDTSSVIQTSEKNEPKNKTDEKDNVLNNTVSMKSSVVQDIPESVFTNYVSVRVIGRNKLAGKHMMSPLTVANMVMEGNPDFCILTSPQTARKKRKIIMNYGSRLNVKDVSIERKENMLARFENNLKKFKF